MRHALVRFHVDAPTVQGEMRGNDNELVCMKKPEAGVQIGEDCIVHYIWKFLD